MRRALARQSTSRSSAEKATTRAIRLLRYAPLSTDAKKTHAHKLTFSAGRYDFWPNRALERYAFITNNDEGLKRIAFPLYGFKNFAIDGQGAKFVFHGFLNPFILDHTDHVFPEEFLDRFLSDVRQ